MGMGMLEVADNPAEVGEAQVVALAAVVGKEISYERQREMAQRRSKRWQQW